MTQFLTEEFLYRANWCYHFVVEFTFHLQRDPWNLGYFIRDFWMGNY